MSVAVVSSRPEVLRWAQSAASGATSTVASLHADPGSADVAALAALAAHVAVLDATADPAGALRTARALREAAPTTAVLLVGDLQPHHLTEALRVQVADVVSPEASVAELLEALRRVAVWEPAAPGRGSADHRTVAVVAPKGGCGKTTVSSNLAVELARRTADEGRRCVLVDLDVQFGDVAAALGLEPANDLTDAVRAVAAGTGLKLLLARHSSGCYVLCAPDSPLAADSVTAEQTRSVLEALHREFDHVVVDTAAGLDEHTLAAVEMADEVVLLASTDLASVNNARKALAVLDVVAREGAARHVVVNRADANVGVRLEDLEASLGAHVDVVVPQDRAVVAAGNAGVPVVVHDGRGPAARALSSLVDRFAAPPARRRRWTGGAR